MTRLTDHKSIRTTLTEGFRLCNAKRPAESDLKIFGIYFTTRSQVRHLPILFYSGVWPIIYGKSLVLAYTLSSAQVVSCVLLLAYKDETKVFSQTYYNY